MKPRVVLIVRVFFYLLATVWLAVGIGYFERSNGRFEFLLMGIAMFTNVPFFIALGANITRPLAYWLGAITLAACVLLTIFDQFGMADLVAVILFLIPLVIMLVKRNEFLITQETS